MKEKIREIMWDFVAGEVTDSEAVRRLNRLGKPSLIIEEPKGVLAAVMWMHTKKQKKGFPSC